MTTKFITDNVEHGYNHDIIYGHYEGDDPTLKEIEEKFYAPMVGGRHPWVDPKTKKFGVAIHGYD